MEPTESESTSTPLSTGYTLDRYEIIAPIGSGGMATVYLARALGPGGFERLVAIKLCHPHLKDEPQFVAMFLHEARLAARIHHPNVISTINIHHADELYLVMDYIEGGSLSALLRIAKQQETLIPIPIIFRIMGDALRGLHAAHELVDHDGQLLDIIHRDVSPQNILIGTDGVSRIADFGIAKAGVETQTTEPGHIKGKYAYMAPEQLCNAVLTRGVDVFAAAVVFWEALTGSRLFRGSKKSETISQVLSGPIRDASSFRQDLPHAVDEILRDALEREPSNRIESAKAFSEALEPCGIDIASQDEVGIYVASMFDGVLERRRGLLRSVDARAQASSSPDDVDIEVTSPTEAALPKSRPARRSGRILLAVTAAAIVIIGLGGGWVLFGGSLLAESRSHSPQTPSDHIELIGATDAGPTSEPEESALPSPHLGATEAGIMSGIDGAVTDGGGDGSGETSTDHRGVKVRKGRGGRPRGRTLKGRGSVKATGSGSTTTAPSTTSKEYRPVIP